MPTITDSIDLSETTISFSLATAPFDAAGQIHSGRPLLATTDENGDFSVTLAEGTYVVRIPHTPAFHITMPSGGGPYDLGELSDEYSAPSTEGTMRAIQGVTDLRAQTTHTAALLAFLDYLTTEGDGQGGWYVYDADSVAADDGIDVIKPTDVAVDAAGRWIRSINP